MWNIIVQARGRPASRPKGTLLPSGKMHFYVPKSTQLFEEEVSAAALAAGIRTPMQGPVAAFLDFGLDPPSQYGREGDVDNLAKSVLDGLRGAGQFRKMRIAYKDDRQVHLLFGLKRFLGPGARPYTKIRLLSLTSERAAIAAYLRELADEIEKAAD